jgi:hypothetical protein
MSSRGIGKNEDWSKDPNFHVELAYNYYEYIIGTNFVKFIREVWPRILPNFPGT